MVYKGKKGIYEDFSSVEQDLESFGLKLKFWLWIPVNGTQRCGIKLHDIHRYFAG